MVERAKLRGLRDSGLIVSQAVHQSLTVIFACQTWLYEITGGVFDRVLDRVVCSPLCDHFLWESRSGLLLGRVTWFLKQPEKMLDEEEHY